MRDTTINIMGLKFPTASNAIQYAEASGDEAITISGMNLVVERAEADRIAAAGFSFAYLGVHEMPDGTERIVTVPVN